MKMTNDEFRNLLIRAQAGDNEAMADILEMFMPLINKHSCVNDRLDEDIRQKYYFKSIKKYQECNSVKIFEKISKK